jgi:acyl-CoA reductase-like NAD-dependent aldehyde dehydrogenase
VLDPDLDSPLMKAEINGPILPVIEFGDIDYVISEIK